MFQHPFVVLDLETTGIDPKNNEILEVALIRYEKGKEVARMSELIKIGEEVPPIITAITGITTQEIRKYGKAKEDVFKKAEALIRDAYLLGHNINFDVGFLKEEGIEFQSLGLIDTVPLAQILFPEALSFSLESLADDLGIKHEESHRAMADVEATLGLFKALLEKITELPTAVLHEIQDALRRAEWEGGVIFQGLKGAKTQRSVVQKSPPIQAAHRPCKPLSIESIFSKGGLLSQSLEGYEDRPQQFEMGQAILNAFEQGYHLICEAPTGVGKSLGYLAPAAEVALKNKAKVVISTNTINLQEQLRDKDLPLLQKIYEAGAGGNLKMAMLKGRSHYLCLRRLAEFRRRPKFTQKEIILLIKILVWQNQSHTGDSGEIYLTPEENLIWNFELSSNQKHCSPARCSAYGECYLHTARELAEQSDLLIVNHALLCADLQNGGGLLPEYQYLVIDEAHHFEEAATSAFATDLSQESLSLPLKAMEHLLKGLPHSDAIIKARETLSGLAQNLDNFFSVIALFTSRNVPDSGYTESLLVNRAVLSMPEWGNLQDSMKEFAVRLQAWIFEVKKGLAALPPAEALQDELEQEMEAIEEQLKTLQVFFDDENKSQQIRWMSSNLSGIVSLHLAPLMVGPMLKEALYDQKKSIILTSATLSVPAPSDSPGSMPPFQYLRRMLDLDERFEELVLDSPFNFETQATVFLPSDILPLTASRSMEQVSEFFASLIGATGGGTLGLFTAYSAIETLYLNLMNRPEVHGTQILAQRLSGGRNKIMKAYIADPLHSVLLGTSSFWEGVDLRGDRLTKLVIHKLPFDVPSEPIFKARQELFGNPFMEYSVPRAVLRFRQGFGRLIRSKSDYGAFVVLDNRLLTKDFGQCFLKALPKGIAIERAKLLEIPGKVKEWLNLSQEKSWLDP